MMRTVLFFLRDRRGNAAAELALVIPILLTLMFGSLELGNLFLDQHALSKQVRDGARFASRLEISDTYNCAGGNVFKAGNADTQIIDVTKKGVVSGTGSPRWTNYWTRTCDAGNPTLSVDVRCVPKSSIDADNDGFTGIYTSLPGDDIPVVTVSGEVKYRSVLSAIGFDATDVCLRANSEAAVVGS